MSVLPVGSTEQHGPALPLCTDFMVAEELDALVDRLADQPFELLLPDDHV